MIEQKTIAVDFDGVIHAYTRGWQRGVIYDKPVPGAFEAILRLHNEGYCVVIHTTRKVDDHSNPIKEWLLKHSASCGTSPVDEEEWIDFVNSGMLKITNIKPKAIAYIDDRAIRFTNWPDVRKYFT